MLHFNYLVKLQAVINIIGVIFFGLGYGYVYFTGSGIGIMNSLLFGFSMLIILFQIPLLLSVYGIFGKEPVVVKEDGIYGFTDWYKKRTLSGSIFTVIIFIVVLLLIDSDAFSSSESVAIVAFATVFRGYFLSMEFDRYGGSDLYKISNR